MKTFGERLNQLRVQKKLAKGELAKMVDVHYSQIGRYERNEASPSADMLKNLANKLDVTTDYLMNGTHTEMAEETIRDKKLINQFNRVAELNKDNQNVVTSLIDAFLFQQETKSKLIAQQQ